MVPQKPIDKLLADWDSAHTGAELYEDISRLYPLCRSITGEGLRESIRFLQKHIPLALHEVSSGTQVFDWTVPKEWNIRDAYIKNAKGERVVDFHKCSLHVLNYSTPIKQKMSIAELRPHLFSLPEMPDWIPYRTSYYKETWGFCLSQNQLNGLADEEYEICIDSTLQPGNLTYGEFRIQGATDDEILISTHSCHPSLCNDNLSGMVIAAKLAEYLVQVSLRYSYRFLWIPGTIGSITWLALNESLLPRIKHGLVLSCLGDRGGFTYKRSRRGNAEIDRVVEQVLRSSGAAFDIENFIPYGYDERQYCSPGINLPMGCFMRTPNGKYPQYHTSADDLGFVTAGALAESLRMLIRCIQVLEGNHRYLNLNPKCEPQLGRRGLYRQMGGMNSSLSEETILWILNFSDGDHSLLDIAARSNLDFISLAEAAGALLDSGLLKIFEKKND